MSATWGSTGSWSVFNILKSGFQKRMGFIHNAYEMGKAFPLTGGGLGTFEFIYPGFQKDLFDHLVEYAHNDWVQLFAETGWPGLVLIGGGFALLLVTSLSRWRNRRDPFSVGIGLGGMGAVVGMAIHSLSDFSLHMPTNALVLALILAITQIALSSKVSRGEEHFASANWMIRPAAWVAISFAVLATLGGTAMAKEILWTWRADSLARAFENSTLPFVEPKDSDLKKAWSLAPGNATYWAWLAMRDRPGGQRREATTCFGSRAWTAFGRRWTSKEMLPMPGAGQQARWGCNCEERGIRSQQWSPEKRSGHLSAWGRGSRGTLRTGPSGGRWGGRPFLKPTRTRIIIFPLPFRRWRTPEGSGPIPPSSS